MYQSDVSPRKFRNMNRNRIKSEGTQTLMLHLSTDNYTKYGLPNSMYVQAKQTIQPHSPKRNSEILYQQAYDHIYEQYSLQQRAREFILKMKREKQQHQGKFFKEKQRQEKKRKQKEKTQKQSTWQKEQMLLQARLEKATQNIIESRKRVQLRLLAAEKKKSVANANEIIQINLPKLQSTTKMLAQIDGEMDIKHNRKRYLIKKCDSERQKNNFSVSLDKSRKKLKRQLKISRKNINNDVISPKKSKKQDQSQVATVKQTVDK